MRIIVDEMPQDPWECPYCKDNSDGDRDEHICTYCNSGRDCWETHECPYFISFKNMFEDEIGDYDVQKYDPYKYG